jgi:hypothetical protein
MAMIRKQIYMPEKMDRQLKREAKRRGMSEAAVIRERLDHTCGALQASSDEEARKQLIQMLQASRKQALKHLKEGTGRDWKFNRDDAYAEREERQLPR